MEEPRRLGGRYELSHVLGRGGMAEVYLAHDTRLGRTVAVKTLRADLARDPSFQARFRREAQSAASLNHPAIVAVYDTGEDYVDNISIPYIVMEYVDGSTLRELLHSGRKLLPERTLEMCIGILQALEYSHRAGIVHRDIKPANVMLTRTGQVKVMDFGIARAMGDSGMTMTQTAAVIGTAQYLSPEQAKGEQVDARSDLYSAGCLLYELLCVRPPFVGDSPVAVAYQHVREEPQPPSNFDPEITPEMDAIVLKALVKDPDYRYQSADEMRADIEACLDGQPVAATASMGAAGYGYPDQGHGYGHQGGYDQPTTALRTAEGGQTAMMAPMPPGGGDGGYGYADQGHGYDQGPHRRQKKSKASTILLVAAGVLVLVGAILIGRSLFSGGADNRPSVPKLVGQTLEQAQKSGDNAGVKVVQDGETECEAQPKGAVCSQVPAADTKVDQDSTVKVKISSGAPAVPVPDVLRVQFDDAEKTLKAKGFQVERKLQESESTAGIVLDQNPKAGSQAKKNDVITLTVAKELSKAEVPDLLGKTREQAVKALQDAKLKLGSVTETESPAAPPKTVIQQQYPAGEQIEVNKTVNITIAKAAQQTQVPNLAQKTVAQAKDELASKGLKFGRVISGPSDDDSMVVFSDPGAGTPVNTGTEVNVMTVRGQGGNNNGGGNGNNDGFIGGLGGR
ncbi:putative serine/threonine-protein kinase [Streptomyces subrutilus]|uniref:non-specific serine/threonine protein kinase n=1 Tax=Streptomyces subrutilus TaxID=36818 RepID=A0A5P2UKX1_9ACTN|nr:Stk1 family PASTA domain-containing Ser/Thr kinase [Streptomyces subrutilus]QEU79778.1 Stk1 family PASTA domain-containing Ser/Thr kinase [Streptomyces subrutilus]GGZ68268.1 putative serine/threonine-protein kinase [Streptomyces subrutilus]